LTFYHLINILSLVDHRYLYTAIQEDALKDKKMVFLSGPRQVGKTTLAKSFIQSDSQYFSWDEPSFAKKWVKDPLSAIGQIHEPRLVLDEIHKYPKWKRSIKGVYDRIGQNVGIIITGSARLDLYKRGGDSLLGRYLPYRLHPFSVAETSGVGPSPDVLDPRPIRYPLSDLMKYSGFPEPLSKAHEQRAKRWSRLRLERILNEDVRDLRNVSNLAVLHVMANLYPEKVGSKLSVHSLSEDLSVAYGTARMWNQLFQDLYYTFSIAPYAKRLARALTSEKKVYLYDPTPIQSPGAKLENIVALHLLKTCHYWTDTAQGFFELRYIRTKEKEEVDFLVLRDNKPWMLVESKSNQLAISPALIKFSELLKPTHSIQTTSKPKVDKRDLKTGIRILTHETFLSMLV